MCWIRRKTKLFTFSNQTKRPNVMNVEFVMTVRSPTFMSHGGLLRDFKRADVWPKKKNPFVGQPHNKRYLKRLWLDPAITCWFNYKFAVTLVHRPGVARFVTVNWTSAVHEVGSCSLYYDTSMSKI